MRRLARHAIVLANAEALAGGNPLEVRQRVAPVANVKIDVIVAAGVEQQSVAQITVIGEFDLAGVEMGCTVREIALNTGAQRLGTERPVRLLVRLEVAAVHEQQTATRGCRLRFQRMSSRSRPRTQP